MNDRKRFRINKWKWRLTSTYLIHGLIGLLLFIFACESDNTYNAQPNFSQSGCLDDGLGKIADMDSLFYYSFDNSLIIDFSVSANCCPDSNRFTISSDIFEDTITITVTDTAAHLCNCTCPYILHTEFYDLPRDCYVVIIYYYGKIKYMEEVVSTILQ